MQSFGRPRSTTNPYIHMLDAALAGTSGLEHVRFSRRLALLGRYDALHFHWPETLFGGSTRPRALARRAFALALRLRLSLTRAAVIRTVHNVEPHAGSSPWERRYLAWLDRRTDHRIVLNAHTPLEPGTPATLIPHGHYRDWFAAVPRVDPIPGALGFVGLIRPYKGVEELLDVFSATAGTAPELSLRVAGQPASDALAGDLRARALADPRVELDLRYLSEDDFATAILRCSGLVLPYRHMHNSGAVLAALSLDRPVLVPKSEVNAALAREVGPGWISTFEGPLTARELLTFAAATARAPAAPPDLSARGWREVGARHRAVFEHAVDARRTSR